jgi:hypothetical protein
MSSLLFWPLTTYLTQILILCSFCQNVSGRYLSRIINFVAIHDGYVQKILSQERYLEGIIRFEAEVFGHLELIVRP